MEDRTMNRCQNRVLIAFSAQMAVLVTVGIICLILAATSVAGIVAILVGFGVFSVVIATLFAIQFANCTR
jgi:hypothetical protein